MMLECPRTDDRQAWYTWLLNGGEATLASLGVSLRFGGYDPKALRDALGEARLGWLNSLPLYWQSAPYLFVYACIAPGVALEDQQAKDMLWIRGRFLDSDADQAQSLCMGTRQAMTRW